MRDIYLGLGTNLGNRRRNLERAVLGLGPALTVTAVSPIYASEPWGITDQPEFLNICLAGRTAVSPTELLPFLKNLEVELGRQETIKWGPRLIDIDILLYADWIVQSDDLTIPHAFLTERAFVLRPLADIAPDVIHPVNGLTVTEMAAAVDPVGLQRLAEPLIVPLAA
ncbi:MAG TPA: 2-amino-4-hydroxy-6-hydroxymethyldihydropteridine diphosphokinase [Anaerolineae bacterium]|nr:2-amino-4-hydroxy-6-hydroxymethyldihydropteridine diphosphokinase [Anaerolineae bacterium]